VDENGAESAVPLADYIEIGVFSGDKDEPKPLYIKKEKLTHERQTFTITVDQKPTLAGIDPYNKLIDRISDDNTINVANQ
jgi:ABC-2 type transport system permease protein